MQCAPYNSSRRRGVIDESNGHQSCFFRKQLMAIARSLGVVRGTSGDTKAVLWQKINKAMRDRYGCDSGDEHCWVERHDAAKRHAQSFAPPMPRHWERNSDAWLSNYDIMNVLQPYERRYPTFKLIGVFPINFGQRDTVGKCISEAICDMRLSSLSKKYNSFGAVFNLDRHDQPGSHWVAVFFSISDPNYGFYYFDSNADPMPMEIKKLARSVYSQLKSPKGFEIRENTVRKQYENSECGMFCIHFIVMCLQRKKFDDIVQNKFYDKHANQLRKQLFRQPSASSREQKSKKP